MPVFKKKQKEQTEIIYGNLYYKCRRCGYEGIIKNVPNFDKVIDALMNGTDAEAFATCNFYEDLETGNIYKECQLHECSPGAFGYMHLVGADVINEPPKKEQDFDDYEFDDFDDDLTDDDFKENNDIKNNKKTSKKNEKNSNIPKRVGPKADAKNKDFDFIFEDRGNDDF